MAAYIVGGTNTMATASTSLWLKASGDSRLPYLIAAPPAKLTAASLATNARSESLSRALLLLLLSLGSASAGGVGCGISNQKGAHDGNSAR